MITIEDAIRIAREGSDKEIIDVVTEISENSELLQELIHQAKKLLMRRLYEGQAMPDNPEDLKKLIAEHSDRLLCLKHPEDPNGKQSQTASGSGMWATFDVAPFETTANGQVYSAKYMNALVLPKSVETVKTIGDTHGSFGDSLVHLIRVIREARKQGQFWINQGDIIDRGEHSVENFVFYLLEILGDPEHSLLVQGNHESAHYMSSSWMKKDFLGEQLRKKIGDKAAETIFSRLKSLFSLLPTFVFSNGLECIVSHAGPLRLEKHLSDCLKRKEGTLDHWLETWGDPIRVEVDENGELMRDGNGEILFFPNGNGEILFFPRGKNSRIRIPENIRELLCSPNPDRISPKDDPATHGSDLPYFFTQFYFEAYKNFFGVDKVILVRGHSLPLLESTESNDILSNVYLIQSTGRGGLDADEFFKKIILPVWGEIDLETLSVEAKQLYRGLDEKTLSEVVLALVYFYLKDKKLLIEKEAISYDAEKEIVTFRLVRECSDQLIDLEQRILELLETYYYVPTLQCDEIKSIRAQKDDRSIEVGVLPILVSIPKNGDSLPNNHESLVKKFVDEHLHFFVNGTGTQYAIESNVLHDVITFYVSLDALEEAAIPDGTEAIQIYDDREEELGDKTPQPLDGFLGDVLELMKSLQEKNFLKLDSSFLGEVSYNDHGSNGDGIFDFDKEGTGAFEEFNDPPPIKYRQSDWRISLSGVSQEALESFSKELAQKQCEPCSVRSRSNSMN